MDETRHIKQEVLLAQLQERYNAMHNMRERSMQFVLWILGLGVGVAWLSINEAVFTFTQKSVLSFLLIAVGGVAVYFVYAIDLGFQKNRGIVIRIEDSLGFFNPKCTNISESILPKEYSSKNKRWNSHFSTLYILLLSFYLPLIILIWVNPAPRTPMDTSVVSDTNQAQFIMNDEVK